MSVPWAFRVLGAAVVALAVAASAQSERASSRSERASAPAQKVAAQAAPVPGRIVLRAGWLLKSSALVPEGGQEMSASG